MLTPTIVTLTMNPALDITTGADVVRPTDKIRCAGSTLRSGRRRYQCRPHRPGTRRLGIGDLPGGRAHGETS